MSLATRLYRHLPMVLAVALLTTASARAQIWNEIEDAGSLVSTAQLPAGPGSLTTINGNLETSTDIDVFCIRIASVASFSAKLSCTVVAEDDLYLFNSGGFGVSAFTGCAGGNVTISSTYVPATGNYYLAVVPSGVLPSAGAGLIWTSDSGSGIERAPDGPGVGASLAGWSGTPALFQVPYTLRLTGCAYCETAVRSSADAWGRLKALYR